MSNNKTKLINLNGYKVLIVQNENFTTHTVGLMYKAGCANDFKGKNGLACLTARLLFRGNKKEKLISAVELAGITITSEVSREQTYYAIESKDAEMKFMLKTLLQITENIDCTEEEVAIEKKIITNELYMKLDDIKESMLGLIHEAVFSRQVIGKPKEGKTRTIQSITKEDIMDFYNKYYNVKNIIIVIATSMEIRDVINVIEPFINGHKTANKSGIFTAFKRYSFYPRGRYTYRNTRNLCVAMASPIAGFKDYHKKVQSDLAWRVLSGQNNCIFSSKIRDAFGITAVNCTPIIYNSIGMMVMTARVYPDQAKEFTTYLYDAVRQVRLSDDIFASAIKGITREKIRDSSLSSKVALEFALHFLNLRKLKKNSFDSEIVSSINKESIVDFIRQLANPERMSFFCLGPRLEKSVVVSMGI